jgi:adenylate kinase family enzyme
MFNSYSLPVPALLLLGPTGVGKSPLGDEIGRSGLFSRKAHHLDFGDELRAAINDRGRSASYTANELAFIHGVLEQGLLLENEHFPLARKIISLFLKRSRFEAKDLLVLNGIPRHAGQARDMASIAAVRAVVVLESTAEVVLARLRENVGGDRTERIDDHAELVEKKLVLFRERTAPLVDHYAAKGCPLYRIDVTASMTPPAAYDALSALAAAHPPVALVAEPPER